MGLYSYTQKLHCLLVVGFVLITGQLVAATPIEWAPLWRDTVNEQGGRHVQSLGPIFESEVQGNVRWEAWRPLAVKFTDEETGAVDSYFLPPLFSWHSTEEATQWRLLLLISGTEQYDALGEIEETSFSVFPFVFRDRDAVNPDDSAFAVFPFYGTVNNSLLFGDFSFVLFPAYVNFHQPEAERYGASWPFIQWQEGPKAGGFAFWPFGGHFYAEDKYDHQFYFWPFIYRAIDDMDQPQPRIRQGFIPFYTIERSATVEDVSIFLPAFGWRDEHDTGYSETRYLWPLWMVGNGPTQSIDRWLPFYAEELEPNNSEHWYLWPLYNEAAGFDDEYTYELTRVLYIAYWNKTIRSVTDPDAEPSTLTHAWPFYSEYHDGKGLMQAQFLSPLSVFFPNSETVKKLYSPLFTFYRMERDANTGVTEQGYFWNFIHERKTEDSTHFTVGPLLEHDVGPGRAKFELLSGLLGIEKKDGDYALRLLWFTID